MHIRVVSVFLLAFLTACMSITARSPGPVPGRRAPPIFESASVTGLVFDRPRPAGSYVTSSRGLGVVVAGPVSAVATAQAIGVATSYDYYKSYEAQDYLRMLLEDTHIVRRVTADSSIEIRGVFLSLDQTTGALNIWNYGSQLMLFGLLGTPLFGSREATVQLRVYQDGELLATFLGRGDCFGRGNIYNATAGVKKLEACALGNAIANAVRGLQDFQLE